MTIPFPRRIRAGAVVLGGVLALGPGAVEVRAQSRDDEAKVGCLRGRPLPACKSFWIVEMQGSTPLAQTRRTVSYAGGTAISTRTFEETVEWNLGHMVNLGSTFALGGVVTAGSGADDVLTGLRVRARRWLSPDVSVEVEGGLVRRNGSGSFYPARAGGTADVRLNIRDQGSFFVRWDGVRVPERTFPVTGGGDSGGYQQAVSVGVGLGSVPALVGSGALGLAYVVLFAIAVGEFS